MLQEVELNKTTGLTVFEQEKIRGGILSVLFTTDGCDICGKCEDVGKQRAADALGVTPIP